MKSSENGDVFGCTNAKSLITIGKLLIKIVVGEKVHFQIPYLGKPKPVITWKFIERVPEEGEDIPADAEEIDLGKHVTIRNTPAQSVLYIRECDRYDTGCYVMRVAVGDKGELIYTVGNIERIIKIIFMFQKCEFSTVS